MLASKFFLGLVLAGVLSLVSSVSAICANSTWIACADEAFSAYTMQKQEFETGAATEEASVQFYCNHTVAYYLNFAACTTMYDCWNYPSAMALRSSRFNISSCTSDNIVDILGGENTNCEVPTCEALLPGSQSQTFSLRSSDSSIACTGTLAALSILAASLIF